MTELIWDGKYKDDKKQGPVRIALPFQTIETVNESTQDRRRNLELFASGRDTAWRNRLIWGDKKYVLPSLLKEFEGTIDVIYIDPPFNTGQDFSFNSTLPESGHTFLKEPSVLEQKAYRDTWGRGQDSYFQWFFDTAVLLRELLAEHGTIFVHLDVHMGPYVKVVMDEVFGQANFLSQIAWYYYNKMHDSRKRILPKAYDPILWYAKNRDADYSFHSLKERRDTPVKQLKRQKVDGRMVNVKDDEGHVVYQMKESRVVDNVWRLRCLQPANMQEWVGFETQKPVDLIERILSLSSDPGHLVLDCFVGSGTAAVAAERLGRRWIACDLGRFAIHTTRKRMLEIPGVSPFVVQNLGKYERQAWQAAEFPANGKNLLEEQRIREVAYRGFILDLYHANPLSGHVWLHGTKAGRMVHVAPVDAPVTQADVKAIARDAWKAVGTGKDSPTKAGVDILGWEFALEVNELAKQVAAESRVDVSFKKIPREVLDKKAVEQGDVRFFELGALSVDPKQKAREVNLKLKDFVIPTDDIPEEARKAVKHWSQLIDYWAVDWDYKNDTFHNQWQAYRTRKDPKIELETKYEYKESGKYQVVVKVIDILGNDTTKTLEVTVK
jgi:DNA modification methylase